ncbi:MAG: bifunctional lysine ketoglutarate reductase /saccharopine dehydrogenase family protein [Acidobacteriota bacterium]|nr:bifunctional lysine ketoglutarate reductase /saccharopine dehydrogenase family protein [Acidobacteriota bacterium]
MKNNIGIRREDISRYERRAPLIPAHLKELIRQYDLEFYVQPSAIRVFPDSEYLASGAFVQEDICPSQVVLAIKEIPISKLEPGKTYVFFSHTIKGQVHNMPMLKKIIDLGCTLIDYEKMTDEQGRRVLFFGNYAGHAGLVDSLWAYGQRLKILGIRTPFLKIRQANNYSNLTELKEDIKQIGKEIEAKGLPPEVGPFICGFFGYGHVSQGAQEIYDLLPAVEIPASELAETVEKGYFSLHRVYKAVFKEEDMVRPKEDFSFDLNDYYRQPEKYYPVTENYLPYLNVLINAIFWTPRYPRFVTRKFLENLYSSQAQPRLQVIGDITCDINGSLECTVRATDSEHPVYVFDPVSGQTVDSFEGRGPVVMAVYNLPAELPLESSTYFSQHLKTYIPNLAKADFKQAFEKIELDPVVKRAVITYRGELTPDYQYLNEYIKDLK